MSELILSVLKIFDPVSLKDTKNSAGDGINFEETLDPHIKSKDADELAKAIQKAVEKSKLSEAEQLKLIERSIAYIRAEGDSDLSSKVYENLKDGDEKNGFLDVFGTANKIPDIVKNDKLAAKTWGQIASGAAYDHIEENKASIKDDLESARNEADGNKSLTVTNPALANLKKQLVESGMSSEEADEDISKMLQQTKLLKSGESVTIKTESSSSTSSRDTTKELEALKKQLTTEINKPGTTPEQVKQILRKSVDEFEKLRPRDNIEAEKFYTEQMQEVLNQSEKYNNYHVAAIPSLRKVDGKELIRTTNEKVFVNQKGQFVDEDGDRYRVTDEKIEVDGEKIKIKDIKALEPKISIVMDQDRATVEDNSLESGGRYIEDQKLVHQARRDREAIDRLDDSKDILDEARVAAKEKRKREAKEGKSDNNDTLTLIVGIVSALATIIAALSQGGGKTTTITGGGGYHGYNGQNGYYGDPRISDKYGYNRGYQATIDAAYQRSNQYLSTMQFNPYLPPGVKNTAVSARADTMRTNGANAINGWPSSIA
jgi:hypothetical protein